MTLKEENDSEVRGIALNVPTYKQQCKRVL